MIMQQRKNPIKATEVILQCTVADIYQSSDHIY